MLPSGDRAKASGWVPMGAPLTPTGTWVTAEVDVSTTLTWSSLVSATNSFFDAPFTSRADGWCPTGMNRDSPVGTWVVGSRAMTDTVPTPAPRPAWSPQLETYRVSPSRARP